MIELDRIRAAAGPLTLAGAPDGFVPWLMADLARTATGRAVLIAADESAMRLVADTAPFFAPDVEVLAFPAWDCLPYDRASPSLRITAERMATLAALQVKRSGPQLLVTTVAAVTQRTLTPFRLRALSAVLAPGERIDRETLIERLHANGYVRSDTVADAGEFAVRGSLIDLYPAGEAHALRLDFFGDEIESLRSFDPADQRTIDRVERFTLLPASETLLDAEAIKRFRARYRETFGATATGDAVYQAVSEGRRQAGMDHWLPLVEDKMATLFDHLGDDDIVVRGGGSDGAVDGRFEAITDYHANRIQAGAGTLGSNPGSYRPLPPDALYLTRAEWDALVKARRVHATTSFRQPPSATVIDLEVDGARDFAPERSRSENAYEAIGDYKDACGKAGVVLAAYSTGSRQRISGLLTEHKVAPVAMAATWQEAQGLAASGKFALVVLPLEHGFVAPSLALITEQDLLGDRLVRRVKRKKSADAFLNELATLSPRDLVVHRDNGIGRYEGLTQIPVQKAPHDCVAISYAGGDKLYVPVENLDVLSRFGSESDGVTLDRLGGEGWQRRKSKMKERIRAIAGDLIAVAAERALKPAEVIEPDGAFNDFVDRFPYEETEDQDRAIDDVFGDLSRGSPMDRLVCGDVGFGKTEVCVARGIHRGDGGAPGCAGLSDDVAGAAASPDVRRAVSGIPAECRSTVTAGAGRGGQDHARRAGRWHDRHRDRDACDSGQERRVQAAGARHCR